MFISQALYKRYIRGSSVIMKTVALVGLIVVIFVLYSQVKESEASLSKDGSAKKKGPKVTQLVSGGFHDD